MSKSKFAALTAGLLARKGEASPSAHSAFMQAAAWAEVTHPHEHPHHKTGVPHDLSELIERAPRPAPASTPAAAPVSASVPPPVPAASLDAAPAPAPASRSFHVVRSSVPAVQPFGMRGRVPPAQAPRMSHLPVAPADDGWSATHRSHRTTVRLDEARYLRLKLTAARYHRTHQDILTRALDAYLTALGIEQVDEKNVDHWRVRLGRLLTR